MPLHTLMFGWEFPPHSEGGLGVACHGLVQGLLQSGTRITLVLPTKTESQHQNLSMLDPRDSESVAYHVFSSLRPYEGPQDYAIRMSTGTPVDMPPSLYGPDMGEAVERFTASSVDTTRHVNADVVHCHDWMTFDAGIRASDHHRIPLVMHVHATEFDRTDFHPNQWIANKERYGLQQADRVIAVSNYTKNLLIHHYGIRPDKIAVVHNAHNHLPARDFITSPSNIPLVLFLGRLTVQKNPWQFLESAKIVHELRPDVQFVMAGDGPMLQTLMDRTCELGLTDSVVFTGKVQRHEVDALYRSASCFVMPSLSEPFGLVALEAISHGVPVVLSKQSGASEVIEHAFKVDFWDTERFADCILTVLRETPLAEQLRAEAPRILQKLTWANQARAVQSIYHDLLRF